MNKLKLKRRLSGGEIATLLTGAVIVTEGRDRDREKPDEGDKIVDADDDDMEEDDEERCRCAEMDDDDEDDEDDDDEKVVNEARRVRSRDVGRYLLG